MARMFVLAPALAFALVPALARAQTDDTKETPPPPASQPVKNAAPPPVSRPVATPPFKVPDALPEPERPVRKKLDKKPSTKQPRIKDSKRPGRIVPRASQPLRTVGKKVIKKVIKKGGPRTPRLFLEERREQTQPLSTDRPGNTDSVTTVAVLHLQIETGVLFDKSTSGGLKSKTFSFPTALRLGVLDGLEIRLHGDIVAIQDREGEQLDAGATDLVFGFRARLLRGSGFLPALAVQLELGIPTGTEGFTSRAVQPELQINATIDLLAGLWVSVNTDIDAVNDTEADEIFWRWGGVAQLGYRPKAFERLAAYVDIFAKVPFDSARDTTLYFSGGATFLLTKDAQLDAYAQAGLTDASSDLSIGLGFAYRL